jgi:hypothetical protein
MVRVTMMLTLSFSEVALMEELAMGMRPRRRDRSLTPSSGSSSAEDLLDTGFYALGTLLTGPFRPPPPPRLVPLLHVRLYREKR